MIFDKTKFYKYIEQLEKSITITYVIVMVFCVIVGLLLYVVGIFITVPIGLLICYWRTLSTKIKIQEMKMQFDLYNKFMNT